MKNLEELKEMIKSAADLSLGKKVKFLSYDIVEDKARLHNDYAEAKRYVEKGGQILVLANDKIYTYKIKNDEKYLEYLKYQIKRENYNKINFYGI